MLRDHPPPRNLPDPAAFSPRKIQRRPPMKGIIAWLLGVPIVVIILLYVFNIF
jgi:hypothetical protein